MLAYSSGIPIGIFIDVLIFRSKITRERPNDIEAIVKALLEARDFVFSNKDEAVKIMADAEGMSSEETVSGLNGLLLPDLKDNIELLNKSKELNSIYALGEVISQFYRKRGQLPEVPDFDDIIEPGFINKLNKNGNKK